MNFQGPNISFPSAESNRLKESENRSIHQEELDHLKQIEASIIQNRSELEAISLKLQEETSARVESEAKAAQERARDREEQRIIDRKRNCTEWRRFIIGTVIGLLTLAAAVFPIVASYLLRG